ncbi:MAG: hypothetical protein HY866_15465 [Chloroflexi bacterium]|nr:hypothetical protein [Chloroflexota bacterium]
MARRLSFLLAVIFLSARVLSGPAQAQGPEGLVVVITWPADGQQLFGVVNISGSALHPTGFASYTLEYNDLSDPNAPWLLVQPRVQQQVRESVLGTWNTNVVPDGSYRLRLRVFLDDGQEGEFVVSNLRVINTQPTPVPTVAPGSTGGEQTGLTPGIEPTSAVVQPPSNNPSVSGLPDPEISADNGGETLTDQPVKKSTRINIGRVRSAFCTGVYLTFGLFALMLGYTLLRGRLRPLTRRLMWQAQDRWDNDQS